MYMSMGRTSLSNVLYTSAETSEPDNKAGTSMLFLESELVPLLKINIYHLATVYVLRSIVLGRFFLLYNHATTLITH
jgi:hypothetical protein